MLQEGLENEIISHFPEEITDNFELPSFRIVNNTKVDKGKDVGGVVNHHVNSVTVFTHTSRSQGKPFRSLPTIKADSIHEIIHFFHNQQRYDVEGFQQISNRINRSYDRRSDLSDEFGKKSITYSNPSPFEYEFIYKPEISGLQRSLGLTLVEDEVLEIFSEYSKELQEGDFSDLELKAMERQLNQDIDEEIDSISDDRIKEYIRPIVEMHNLTNFEDSHGFRDKDEALARFYVTATLPEYTLQVIENSICDNDVSNDLSHDNPDFSKFFMDNVEIGYDGECASEFYQLTEEYRELREQGYGEKEAADKILVGFLDNVETISY